jgi:peroxiredoxin
MALQSNKIFKLIFLILFISDLNAQSDSVFTIKGKINGLVSDRYIWLQSIEEDPFVLDSIKTINGEFEFKGMVNKPSLYSLNIGKSTKESFRFFIENSNITLNCDYKYPFGCEVKGSYNQHLIDEFAIREQIAWNPEVIENLKNTYVNFAEKAGYIRKQKFTEAIKSFVLLHPSDRSLAYLVSLNSNYILDEELESIFESFGPSLKTSVFAKEIKADIEMRNATQIGRVIRDLKQTDLNGETVNLSNFAGKYVLLHFWASGFAPSRVENYKLLKVYQKYKDNNFDVIAVSVDSVAKEWERAVLEDNLDWNNVSDLKGWDNAIAKKLGIQAIPYSILLDREGVIIARDMRPEELDNILNLIVSASKADKEKGNEKKGNSRFKKLFPKKKQKSNEGALPGATDKK